MADNELEFLRAKRLNIMQQQSVGVLHHGVGVMGKRKRKRNEKRSNVWYHYVIAESKKNAQCNHCQASISICGSSGNLSRHLKMKHPGVSDNDNEQFGIVPNSTVSPSEQLDDSNIILTRDNEMELFNATSSPYILSKAVEPLTVEKKKQIDERLAKMICKQFLPFSFVEDAEFKRFVRMLNPEYKLQKTLFRSFVSSLYEESKTAIQKTLNSAPAVCLTTDGWTSSYNTSFLTLTAHYLTADTKLRLHSSLLSCEKFVETPTALTISDWLITTTAEWHISNKIVGIVTDNAANMTDAICMCNWHHIPCFAQSLNLVVQKGLLEINEIVHKVRASIEHLKESIPVFVELERPHTPVKLKLDVMTSWYSTYEMLQRFFENKDVLTALALLDPESESKNILFDDEWWLVLELCIHILQSFVDAIKEITAENTVTVSKISILPRIIIRKLNSVSDDPRIVKMKEVMIEELCVQFLIGDGGLENHPIVAQAVFLDPRFKKHGFSSTDKLNEVENAVKEELQSITYCTENASTVEISHSSLWEDFDETVQKHADISNSQDASAIEVDKYLDEPLVSRQIDPLSWWNERKAVYPRLYKLMLRTLCVPASSVPCEHIFSKIDHVIDKRKTALNSSKVEMMVFLNHNL